MGRWSAPSVVDTSVRAALAREQMACLPRTPPHDGPYWVWLRGIRGIGIIPGCQEKRHANL